MTKTMALKDALKGMRTIESTGFADPERAKEYFEEKERLLEAIVHTLEELEAEGSADIGLRPTSVVVC